MKLKLKYRFCYPVWIPALILLAIGLLFVFSASSGYNHNYMPRQRMWIFIGMFLSLIVSLVPFRNYHSYAAPIYALGIFLLMAVLVFGVERNGAKCWLGIGSLGIQPSEFVKITVILIFGRYLEDFEEHRYDIRYYFLSFILLIIPIFLILLQPDLGSVLIFIPIVLAIFFVTGTRLTLIATTFSGLLASFPVLWFFILNKYQKERIYLTWRPEIDSLGYGWQGAQSKIAIGSGGLFGTGFQESVSSKLNFLPERHTDFIFSIIGEELGFIGCVTVLLVYLMLIFGAFHVATKARTVFGEAVAVGIGAMFATQLIMNVGMAVCILPIIGVPLPLISYGGSSMMTALISLGILQSIYSYGRVR